MATADIPGSRQLETGLTVGLRALVCELHQVVVADPLPRLRRKS